MLRRSLTKEVDCLDIGSPERWFGGAWVTGRWRFCRVFCDFVAARFVFEAGICCGGVWSSVEFRSFGLIFVSLEMLNMVPSAMES